MKTAYGLPAPSQTVWSPSPLDGEKNLSHTLAQAQKAQAARPAHSSAPEHPWRCPFKSALRFAS